MEIILLAEACKLGLKRYFTGKPCKHGHLCERKVIGRSCVECNKKYNESDKHKEWYKNNKDHVRDQRHQYYENNKEIIIERSKQWHLENPERSTELKRNWRHTEKGLAQSRNWVANNPEKHAKSSKNWKEKNPDLVYEYTGTRRATKLNATPSWLTKEDRKEIRVLYSPFYWSRPRRQDRISIPART